MSIFVTTFNLGEAKLSSVLGSLADWILLGHDVYSIGLQECLDLAAVREAIHIHLGGSEQYSVFCTEIGSDNTSLGFHGFIALTVFVRTADVSSGAVRKTLTATKEASTGQNLIITTAQNKGAVGIPFQIHDTSVAFLTSHLPSDQKGKSKLKRRNDAAATVLKDVVLAPHDARFDMHLLHDHVFFTGDLNYRINPDLLPTAAQHGHGAGVSLMQLDSTEALKANPLTAPLVAVAEAASVEKEQIMEAVGALTSSSWVTEKYALLCPSNAAAAASAAAVDELQRQTRKLAIPHGQGLKYPPPAIVEAVKNAKENSSSLWRRVLAADELSVLMNDGLVFEGFFEEGVTFPPSYKRCKGPVKGGCGDYTDAAELAKGFSNLRDEDEEDEERSAAALSLIHI